MSLVAPVAVVLAAGASERLGPDKMLAKLEGKRLIRRAVDPFVGAQKVTDVVVVVPPDRKRDFSFLRTVRVHLVENPDPSRGMISSIRVGLRSGWVAGKDFLICPGDIPYLRPELVDKVVQTFMTRDSRIVVPTYMGLGGHPGMFAASLADDFFLHGDNHGTREILLRYRDETTRISIPEPDLCFDVDTPEDLALAPDAGARWAHVQKKVEEKRKLRLR